MDRHAVSRKTSHDHQMREKQATKSPKWEKVQLSVQRGTFFFLHFGFMGTDSDRRTTYLRQLSERHFGSETKKKKPATKNDLDLCGSADKRSREVKETQVKRHCVV